MDIKKAIKRMDSKKTEIKKILQKGKPKENRVKKVPLCKTGIPKKTVLVLWILLGCSFCFAVYKNFTAVDLHTVHETKVIEEKIVDTNKVENFVRNFAKAYYTWEQTTDSIEKREKAMKGYLTKELQALNVDTIRKDIPVSSSVKEVQVWEVIKKVEKEFTVMFTVEQLITEGGDKKTVRSAYEVNVHMDDAGNMVIIKNPTICSVPKKSGYEPKIKESGEIIDFEEAEDFLKTFFKLYPTATAKELTYYVKNGVLKPVGYEYTFAELVNPIYSKKGKQVWVSVTVNYLDPRTNMEQLSQFDLILEKQENWKIVGEQNRNEN